MLARAPSTSCTSKSNRSADEMRPVPDLGADSDQAPPSRRATRDTSLADAVADRFDVLQDFLFDAI